MVSAVMAPTRRGDMTFITMAASMTGWDTAHRTSLVQLRSRHQVACEGRINRSVHAEQVVDTNRRHLNVVFAYRE
jgi:hypothetical protein